MAGGRGIFQESDGSGGGDEVKPTPGLWKREENTLYLWGEGEENCFGIPILKCITTNWNWARKIPQEEHEANLDFVAAAYNQCVKINPNNPQAIAEGIGEMYDLCQEAVLYLQSLIKYKKNEPELIRRMKEVLQKVEG